MPKKVLYERAINDSDEPIARTELVEGKRKQVWLCPFYRAWKGMITRAYSPKYLSLHPSYKGVEVCQEWLLFTNFRTWMESQDWEGKDLDKDLLSFGKTKIYSPETCCFIRQEVNKLLCLSDGSRGKYPIGVGYTQKSKGMKSERSKPYNAHMSTPSKRYNHLGNFTCPIEAHRAWQKAKFEQFKVTIAEESDERVKFALLRIALKLQRDFVLQQETTSFVEDI